MTDDDSWYDPRFDAYMTAVGRIALMWAHLEYNLNEAIWELENVESAVGACVTAQIFSASGRLRALISLVHHRGAPNTIIRKLNKLGQKIEGLGRQRNEYVHHPVSLGIETGKLTRVHVSADRQLDFKFKPTDLNEMRKLFRNIRFASVEFDALYDRILSELPPWPRKQFGQSDRGFRRRKQRNNAQQAHQPQRRPSRA
jgi:hypothetical protein